MTYAIGDRVWHQDDPDTLGTIVRVGKAPGMGGTRLYDIRWDDGLEGNAGDGTAPALESDIFPAN